LCRSSGPILQAQPAPWTVSVNRILVGSGMAIDVFLPLFVVMQGVGGHRFRTPEVLIPYFMATVKPSYHKRSL
jgi:hypothetical protein